MKVTVNIDDNEIQEAVFDVLVRNVARTIFEKDYGEDNREYLKAIKKAVTAAVQERSDEIVERCIPLAADYIGRKGLKKIAEKLTEETQ